jgi:X-Pro dipeptidyl-peptidase (S15 family)
MGLAGRYCPAQPHFIATDASFQTPVEGADEYDLIEWAAQLPWCNGNIGLGGVSYLVQSQWMVYYPLRVPTERLGSANASAVVEGYHCVGGLVGW